MIEAARAAAARGGYYISHIRDEADLSMDAIREAIAVGERAKLPVQITHLKLGTVGVWGQANEVVALVEAAREARRRRHRRRVSLSGLAVHAQGAGAEQAVRRPGERDPRARRHRRGQNVQITRWSAYPQYVGKRLDEMARGEGISDVEAYVRFAKDDDAGMIGHAMIEDDLKVFYRQPWVMVASDGGIGNNHPRGAGTFPRVLGRYVREQQWLTLPDAIRKMTAMPAARMGLKDRGVLKSGMKADLVLFDPATVTDNSTFENPRALSTGIATVWVNGVVVWNGRAPGAATPGRVLAR